MYFSSSVSLLFLSALLYFDCVLCTRNNTCPSLCNPKQSSYSFGGNIAPVFTPFYKNGSVDFSIVPIYVKFLATNGIKTIYVNGPDGGSLILSYENRNKLLKKFLQECKPYGIQVMVEVGGQSCQEVMMAIKYAKKQGVCAISVLPEIFYRPNMTDQAVEFLKVAAEEAYPIPIYYNDLPEQTGVNLNMVKLVAEAGEISNFAGIITSLATALEVKPISDSDNQVSILVYGVYAIPSVYSYCFDGAINLLNTIVPSLTNQLESAIEDGNYKSAVNCQLRYNDISTQIISIANFDQIDGKIYTVIRGLFRTCFMLVTEIHVGYPFLLRKTTPQERERIRMILKRGGII